MPVRDDDARRFVAEHFGSRVTDVRALAAGEWSRAYAMVLDAHRVVIRFGDHVEDFRKDRMVAVHGCSALPIPAVIEIGAAGDGYFAVSEQATGELLDGLDEAEMRAVLPGLLAALDAIRQIGVPGSRGYGIWAPDGVGPAASWPEALLAINQETTRVRGWRAALQRVPASTGCFDRA
jgi:hygromycin-B 4-O-kinase